ncbi:lysM and putative peptidoglycan-binding domain-containing protein 1 [Chiroxiphia lanceolata]|uniref:lysM and putative peptidoglycan-binding domain-containing protein 1 n=1 Tax=Chiroxiphia lanceolata TaxID=296741 RepID=UPI0013CF0F7D|nr:lysM and putative peptidoglycan-binding domain-containing protein 1 [Chiroxiphia lanceolata]XP_032568793.1 lysM and putative peptidoglycan-binding domain-containing protein 1 [Chiroxiphia lanceolata]XP_032568794.1 lysM and putative peptidoglycan-binding domain-containing protein 1 [Chiroxiphia lanceolata]XP_032568795.1 lysM and putative peptidoglycan-binding domain-containing protein 1 [Chiroxiphia lanceolata]
MAGSGGAGAAPREHRLQPGDTLQGLALRYGVTMEQIQRANRLYTSDTIFLKPTLLIPAGSQSQPLQGDEPQDIIPNPPEPPVPSRHDLSAMEFLRHLDTEIGRSKAAAAQQIRHRHSGPGDSRASQRIPEGPSSPREGPRLGPRPLTRTPRAAALRDTEDEIFTL